MIRSRAARFLLIGLSVVVLLAITHSFWMPRLGYALVQSEAPARADAVLVLAGDFYGNRILKAAELARAGYVPKVLVSGPDKMYGHYECDLAIGFAIERGYPRDWFVRMPNQALSTRDEADTLLSQISKMGVKHLIIVTSDYHTARAGRIFRGRANQVQIRMVAAPDEYFRPDAWWRSRQSEKIFFMEWSKTVAEWLGI